MGTHAPLLGLSNRAYARRQKCTEAAIRKARADGRLAGAILPDGSINAEKADALLAGSATSGERIPLDLSEARRLKLAAQCVLLNDDVEELRGSVVLVADAKHVMLESCLLIARRLYRLPREISVRTNGLPIAQASAVIQDAARQALSDLSSTEVMAAEGSPTPEPELCLDGMDRTELATLKATLQTAKLNIIRDRRKGVVLNIADMSSDMVNRLSALRSKLLGMHAKTAGYVATTNAAGAEKLFRREIEDFLQDLADDEFVPIGALLAVAA